MPLSEIQEKEEIDTRCFRCEFIHSLLTSQRLATMPRNGPTLDPSLYTEDICHSIVAAVDLRVSDCCRCLDSSSVNALLSG